MHPFSPYHNAPKLKLFSLSDLQSRPAQQPVYTVQPTRQLTQPNYELLPYDSTSTQLQHVDFQFEQSNSTQVVEIETPCRQRIREEQQRGLEEEARLQMQCLARMIPASNHAAIQLSRADSQAIFNAAHRQPAVMSESTNTSSSWYHRQAALANEVNEHQRHLSVAGALERTPNSILQHKVHAVKLSSPLEARVLADIRSQIMQIDDVSDQIRERTQRAAAEVRQMLFAAAAEEENKRTAAERLQAHRDRAVAAVQTCLSECRQLNTSAIGMVNSIRSASEELNDMGLPAELLANIQLQFSVFDNDETSAIQTNVAQCQSLLNSLGAAEPDALTAAESSAQTCIAAIQTIVHTLQQNSDRARQLLGEARQQKETLDKQAAVASTEPIVYVVPEHIDLGRPTDVSSNRGATFHSSRDCAILALRAFCGRNNLPVDAACITAHQLPVAKAGRALACVLCSSPLSSAAAVSDVERVRLVLQQTRELAGRYRQSVDNDSERIRLEVERGQGRAMRMLAATLESMQHAREEMFRELDRLREPTIYCCAILHYVSSLIGRALSFEAEPTAAHMHAAFAVQLFHYDYSRSPVATNQWRLADCLLAMCYEACPALSAVYTHRGQFAGRSGRVEYRRSLGYRDQLNMQNGEIASSVDESDANYVARCEGVARLLGAIFHHKPHQLHVHSLRIQRADPLSIDLAYKTIVRIVNLEPRPHTLPALKGLLENCGLDLLGVDFNSQGQVSASNQVIGEYVPSRQAKFRAVCIRVLRILIQPAAHSGSLACTAWMANLVRSGLLSSQFDMIRTAIDGQINALLIYNSDYILRSRNLRSDAAGSLIIVPKGAHFPPRDVSAH